MRKVFVYLFLIFSSSIIYSSAPQCYNDLATHFFNDDKAIMQALSLHRVTESSWTPIVHSLQRESRRVVPLLEQRARQLDVNPLSPFVAEKAEVLLNNTLLEVFGNVLNNYLITNPSDIFQMLDYIRRHQPLWDECFKTAEVQRRGGG